MIVDRAANKDCRILAEMAIQLWDGPTIDDLEAEFKDLLNRGNTVVFIQYEAGTPAGFAECSLRTDYVEGTESTPVGYLEGIFVKKEYRNRGCARDLLSACEKWAKDNGCAEFASDCELDNTLSLKFHTAMGFTEVNRIICFKKDIKK